MKNVLRFEIDDLEEGKRVSARRLWIFEGDTTVSGFSSFSGIAINSFRLEIDKLKAVKNKVPPDLADLTCEVSARVIIMHEAVHTLYRHYKSDLNALTPPRNSDGINEGGTMIEVDVLGEEIDYFAAVELRLLTKEWLQQFLTACSPPFDAYTGPLPKLPIEAIRRCRARSKSMTFKRYYFPKFG